MVTLKLKAYDPTYVCLLRADRIGSKTFRERDAAEGGQEVYLEVVVPFLAGTYDEHMYEELQLRAQTFEVLTGGEFTADHLGQDDTDDPQGEQLGLSVLPLSKRVTDDLRVKLQVWEPLGEFTPIVRPIAKLIGPN